jgi:plasmid stabilization system protein ParE
VVCNGQPDPFLAVETTKNAAGRGSLPPFQVFLTDAAARDLEDLYDYSEKHDAPGKLIVFSNTIEMLRLSVGKSPNAGPTPTNCRPLDFGNTGKFISNHTASFTGSCPRPSTLW